MRQKKGVFLLIMISFFLLLPSGVVCAKERSIYIGDLIVLKITTQNITEEELKDKFSDFEVVELEKEADGYTMTVRSFEPGEYTIALDQDTLKLTVKSTLKDSKRDVVYEGNTGYVSKSFSLKWKILFYSSIGFFLVSISILVVSIVRRRKTSVLTPYQSFVKSLEEALVTDEGYFIKITSCLKNYIEARYSCNVRGKSSAELETALLDLPDLAKMVPMLRSWLEKCDYYKFTGALVSVEKKQELKKELREFVTAIDKEGAAV